MAATTVSKRTGQKRRNAADRQFTPKGSAGEFHVLSDETGDHPLAPSRRVLCSDQWKGATFKVVAITPQIAIKWLERTAAGIEAGLFRGQRDLAKSRVTLYVAEMLALRWMFNGEPIVLSKEKYVLNGQHRLRAIVETGFTVYMLVVFGVNKAAYPTFDTPKVRSAKDAAKWATTSKSYSALSAAVKWLPRYERRAMLHSTPVTNLHVNALISEHPRMEESLERTLSVHQERVLPWAPAAFAHYLFAREDRAAADEFFARLADGVGLRAKHPVLVLRNMLAKRRGHKDTPRSYDQLASVFKAWKLFRSGETATSSALAWRRKGPRSEDFPYLEDGPAPSK